MAINGAEIPETTRGPTKDRGTTPGNTKWSYCNINGIFKRNIFYSNNEYSRLGCQTAGIIYHE